MRMPILLLPGAVRGAGVDPGGDVAQQTDPLLREDDQGDHRPPSRHSRNIIYIPPLNICPSQAHNSLYPLVWTRDAGHGH